MKVAIYATFFLNVPRRALCSSWVSYFLWYTFVKMLNACSAFSWEERGERHWRLYFKYRNLNRKAITHLSSLECQAMNGVHINPLGDWPNSGLHPSHDKQSCYEHH